MLIVQNRPLTVYVTTGIYHAITSGTDVDGFAAIPCIVDGGFPPYTYSWTDNSAFVSVTGATSAAATMQYIATGSDTNRTGIFIVSATDATGRVAVGGCTFDITMGTPP